MNQPLAYVHPQAQIAQNVVIEPFSSIDKNVEIGEGTWIGSNVTIMDGARIGKNCKIFPGAIISAIPQDLKYNGEETVVIIGNNTTIRECVTINKGTIDKRKTEVGDNCLIMAYVHLGHDCIIEDNCIIGNSCQFAGHVTVNNNAIFGGNCSIQQFTKIGIYAYVGGGSLVRKDIPPYTKAAREPLSYSGINSVGLRRGGYSSEKINEIQEVYRYLFLKGINNSSATELIELELPPSKERDEILNFIRTSNRGIMKGYNK